jgi:drug/metabolite transporter (DMT)-like permease
MGDIMADKNVLIGVVCGLAAAAIWGGMYVVSKLVLEIIPPFTLLTLRLVLGIAVLWLVIKFTGGMHLSRSQTIIALGVGLVGYGVSLGLQFVGTRLSTASNGALVTSATPAFVLPFAAWLLKERITRKRVIALVVSLLGVLAVIDPRSANLSPDLFWGNIILLGAAITWALYSVLVRQTSQDLPLLPGTMTFFVGGLLVSVPAAGFELQRIPVGEINSGVVLGVLYLGVISTALAMYLWNKAFTTLEAGAASLTMFAQPVVGAGLGALFLNEELSLLYLVGGGLIGLGIWLAVRGDTA